MSPNVGNFVHDLVEMAKAMEELPKVQDQLADANGRADALAETVAARETSILSLKAEIEVLNHKLNAAEVARDDAEYRFLELDEKAAGAVNLVRAMQATLGQVTEKLDPPKPQPAPEPIKDHAAEELAASPYTFPPMAEVQAQPEAIQSQGQGVADPTGAAIPGNANSSTEAIGASASTVESKSAEPSWKSHEDLVAEDKARQDKVRQDTAEGQSDPRPTPAATQEPQSPSAGSQNASPCDDAATSSTEDKPSGPYTGKLYYDHPAYVPLSEWLAGGGTDDDYNWRPAHRGAF